MNDKLTIVIPVKDKEETVDKFIEGNKEILTNFKVITVDTNGGNKLKKYSFVYIDDIEDKYTMPKARILGVSLVDSKYVLNLDTHVILSKEYIIKSISLLDNDDNIGAISIEHKRLMGHLGFGQSIWRTQLLKELYDYREEYNKYSCECVYMWNKINVTKYRLETIDNIRCEHIRG